MAVLTFFLHLQLRQQLCGTKQAFHLQQLRAVGSLCLHAATEFLVVMLTCLLVILNFLRTSPSYHPAVAFRDYPHSSWVAAAVVEMLIVAEEEVPVQLIYHNFRFLVQLIQLSLGPADFQIAMEDQVRFQV